MLCLVGHLLCHPFISTESGIIVKLVHFHFQQCPIFKDQAFVGWTARLKSGWNPRDLALWGRVLSSWTMGSQIVEKWDCDWLQNLAQYFTALALNGDKPCFISDEDAAPHHTAPNKLLLDQCNNQCSVLHVVSILCAIIRCHQPGANEPIHQQLKTTANTNRWINCWV